jgi:ferrochelatase
VLLISLGEPQSVNPLSVRRLLTELRRDAPTDSGPATLPAVSRQAAALAETLPDDWRVYWALRCGKPAIAESLGEIEAGGVEKLVVVPMYPQFSHATTGAIMAELYRILGSKMQSVNVATRATWYDDLGYVNAQARVIAEYATSNDLAPDDTQLVLAANGLWTSTVRRREPYAEHVKRTARLVAERVGWPAEQTSMTFRGRFGLLNRLRPDAAGTLADLARAGERKVLLCPLTIASEGLANVTEISADTRERFAAFGGEVHLCPQLDTQPVFITALKNLALKGPRPVSPDRTVSKPLLTPKSHAGKKC